MNVKNLCPPKQFRWARTTPLRQYALQALAVAALTMATAASNANEFDVGTGIYDITGPVAETGMFGYADGQVTDGLHQRVYARAFIIKDRHSSKRVVFVNTDLGALFQSVKLEVVKRLKLRFGHTYTAENVMIAATHTHVSSGGMSHYKLYQLAVSDGSGFTHDKLAFESTVSGIVNAITRAHNNIAPGSVELAKGDLINASRNRSLQPYLANPDASRYAHDTNKEMLQLKFTKASGKEVGVLNWFAIHPTSFSKDFTKVSGDNKGYAEWRFEKAKGTRITDNETFVAGFANAETGDVVATDGNTRSAPGYEGGRDEYANAEAAGRKQFDRAWQLYNGPQARLSGQVDFRHQWVRMNGYTVTPAFTGDHARTLCKAMIGASFAAGGENGPTGIPGVYEGMLDTNTTPGEALKGWDDFMGGTVRLVFGTLNVAQSNPCQQPKSNLLPVGVVEWVPPILPYQVFVVGKMAIVGLPVEVNTMVGRRIRERLLSDLSNQGVDTVAVTSMTNTYSGYLSTKEEYNLQHYEGASTLYGPYQAAATEQIVSGLAKAIANDTTVTDTATPEYGQPSNSRPGVFYDGKGSKEFFGQVLTQPKANYKRGETVTVSFRGGHPKNNLRTQSTFLSVEQLVNGHWVSVADDADWHTTYQWKREGLDRSVNEVIWRIPTDTTPGRYRIRHFGEWKKGWNGKITSYAGTSTTFIVN